jgi:hypothetical protein
MKTMGIKKVNIVPGLTAEVFGGYFISAWSSGALLAITLAMSFWLAIHIRV